MKPVLLTLLISCFTSLSFAQDVLIRRNGDEIAAKVLEITLQEILYRHPDSLQGPTLRLAKAEVFMIRFANGTREVFQESPAQQVAALPSEQLYQLGQRDARLHYKGKEAMWGAAASSLLFPYGLAGAVVIGAVPPKVRPDGVSDINLLSNPDYVRGYEKEAHRRKVGKVATGAGMGTLAGLMVALVVVLSAWN